MSIEPELTDVREIELVCRISWPDLKKLLLDTVFAQEGLEDNVLRELRGPDTARIGTKVTIKQQQAGSPPSYNIEEWVANVRVWKRMDL